MRSAIRIGRIAFPVVAVLVLGYAVAVYGGYGTAAGAKAKATTPGVISATVEGENFCVGCSLKKEKGAPAQCSVYGHRHALRVTKATGADGKEIKKLKGWVLHYLENDKSKDLIKGHHGEKLSIKGRIYPTERVLSVQSFKPAAKATKKPAKPRSEGTSY
ncbi:MAG: hypothetical protein ACE5O2_03710 [Armatimonadota bacterium]